VKPDNDEMERSSFTALKWSVKAVWDKDLSEWLVLLTLGAGDDSNIEIKLNALTSEMIGGALVVGAMQADAQSPLVSKALH